MSKFTTMMFQEGGCGDIHTHFVGKKALFKDKQAFLAVANIQDELEGYTEPTLDNVKEGYVRYYPNMPWGFEVESGWTFCEKARGAVEVYFISFAELGCKDENA